jgi:hypothetical protein
MCKKLQAPVLTVFVGGNHEASNHLTELCAARLRTGTRARVNGAARRFHGGWVAPNIYYMGFSGVLRFGGLRIAGLTGIFKGFDYTAGSPARALSEGVTTPCCSQQVTTSTPRSPMAACAACTMFASWTCSNSSR